MNLQRPISSVIPGATGKILEVLARVTSDLNLSTVARLAGVSPAQASRVLPRLVELGLVTRWNTPPSQQLRLNRENLAARKIEALLNLRAEAEEAVRNLSRSIKPAPANITLFGSFARDTATAESDIDLLVVRPAGVYDDDESWVNALIDWEIAVQDAVGNKVNVLEISEDELGERLSADSAIWQDIAREGITLLGKDIRGLAKIL